MKNFCIILLVLLLLTCNNSGSSDSATGNDDNFDPSDYNPAVDTCSLIYEAPSGDGRAGVGDYSRNSYRGMYWTGESMYLHGGEVRLHRRGNVNLITYVISVYTVDVANDLKLGTLLGTVNISGSSIVDGWNAFTFPNHIAVPSGSIAILISRTDPATHDYENFIQVYNGYDESDQESRQWNAHYHENGNLAGRGPGDENQPEYFTCDWKLVGADYNPSSNLEYPNIPEDINATAQSSSSILVEWSERGSNNVTVDHYNIYHYNTADAGLTLRGTSATTSYTDRGLSSGTTYTYVVTAVSSAGQESSHSLDNGGNWSATTN